MPGSTTRAAAPRAGKRSTIDPRAVERWLRDLGLEPTAVVEREGISAWDVAIDGRRRRDPRARLSLDPATGEIVGAHLAPPLGDGLRKAYRTLLRWNDEFPLAKFSVADDGRAILAVQIPSRWLSADELGLSLVRVALIADAIFDETRGWLWIGGRVPDGYDGPALRAAPPPARAPAPVRAACRGT